MKPFSAFPMLVGGGQAERIETLEPMYEYLAECILGVEIESRGGDCLPPIFLPKTFMGIDDSASKAILRASTASNIVIFDFVHFSSVHLPTFQVFHDLNVIVHQSPESTTFCVILEWIEGDTILDAIADMVALGRIIVMDENGQVYRPDEDTPHFDIGRLQSIKEETARGPVSSLLRRIVRHVGHYVKYRDDGSIDHCNKYFYDGKYAQDLILENILDVFAESWASAQFTSVIVVAPRDHWLVSTGDMVAREFALALVVAPSPDLLAELPQDVRQHSLVLLPMCDSGATAAKAIRTLMPDAREPTTTELVAVFSTGSGPRFRGARTIEVDAGRVAQIKYVIRVPQKHTAASECRSCRAGVKNHYEFDPVVAGHPSPEVFWTLVLDAGVRLEGSVPYYRRASLGYIPNFTRMARLYPTFVASMLLQLLGNSPGRLPADLVVVCPDEGGARAISRGLSLLSGCQVIRVPREVIREAEAAVLSPHRLAQLGDDEPIWYQAVLSVAGRLQQTQPIIIDEFNASGSTLRGLSNLLNSFDLEPRCAASFVDFSSNGIGLQDLDFYSCYQIAVA